MSYTCVLNKIYEPFFPVGGSYKIFILAEICIVSIHPIWIVGKDLNFIEYNYLYFLMLARLLYIFRIFIVNSRVFYSTKVETVASLNKISTGQLTYENIRLIVRSTMERYAGKVMMYVMCLNWVVVAWLIHLTESQYNIENNSSKGVSKFIDALWLVPITFTTIGAGKLARSCNTLVFHD